MCLLRWISADILLTDSVLVFLKKLRVSEDVSEEGKTSRASQHLADMKKSLSKEHFDRIIAALQTYKNSDRLDDLLAETSVLSEDRHTHSLLRGSLGSLGSLAAAHVSSPLSCRFLSVRSTAPQEEL